MKRKPHKTVADLDAALKRHGSRAVDLTEEDLKEIRAYEKLQRKINARDRNI